MTLHPTLFEADWPLLRENARRRPGGDAAIAADPTDRPDDGEPPAPDPLIDLVSKGAH